MSLKARGVTEIYAADVLDKRLEKALEVGATRVFNVAISSSSTGSGETPVRVTFPARLINLQVCNVVILFPAHS